MKQIKNSLIIDNNLFTAFNNPLWQYAFPDTTELDTYFILKFGDRIASKALQSFENDAGIVTGDKLTALANMIYNINKVKWQHLFDIYNTEYNPAENTDYTETFKEHSSSTGHSESTNGVTYKPGTTATNKKYGFNGGGVNDTQTIMSGTDQTDSDGEADTNGTVDHTSELRKHGNIGTVDVTDMLAKSAAFWKWTFIDAVCKDICDFIALSIY